jgi:nitrous oxidase accessory protein NosD
VKASAVFLLVSLIMTSLYLVNTQPVRANPQTIIVPDDYPTIEWAIGNASEDDTIYVKKGTYYEHLAINKSISLIGEDTSTTIIDGNFTGNVVNVTTNNVEISEFTIENSGTRVVADEPTGIGIYVKMNVGSNIINNSMDSRAKALHTRKSGINIPNS